MSWNSKMLEYLMGYGNNNDIDFSYAEFKQGVILRKVQSEDEKRKIFSAGVLKNEVIRLKGKRKTLFM